MTLNALPALIAPSGPPPAAALLRKAGFARSNGVLFQSSLSTTKKGPHSGPFVYGGEGGIRTRDTVTRMVP